MSNRATQLTTNSSITNAWRPRKTIQWLLMWIICSTSAQTFMRVSLYSVSLYPSSSHAFSEIINLITFEQRYVSRKHKGFRKMVNLLDKGYFIPTCNCFSKIAVCTKHHKGNIKGSHRCWVLCYKCYWCPSCRFNEWSERPHLIFFYLVVLTYFFSDF